VSADGKVSHIAVATAPKSTPWGPFTYKTQVTYQGANISNLYMSDPAVATMSFSHPGKRRDGTTNEYLTSRAGGPAAWLLWANGDYNNGGSGCGDLSIGLLDDVSMTELIDNPDESVSRIDILGIETLGTCEGTDHPYLEGPELYDLTQANVPLPGGDRRFMLVFSAKPSNRDQVMAYATASNLYGPYTYEGILMEASDSSWTNHGSIYADTSGPVSTANPFGIRFILFFHDDSGGTRHNRKMYAACLTFDLSDGRFAAATRPSSAPNLNNCAGFRA
jgi:hypothetical protein